MPVFDCFKEKPLVNSEVNKIEIIRLEPQEVYLANDHNEKEKVFVMDGKVLMRTNENIKDYKENDFFEFNKHKNKLVEIIAFDYASFIRIGGNWNEETRNCGVFELSASDKPKNIGDPVEYDRNTDFDNHYHDCNEFWIIYEGSGEIVTEGNGYRVKAGDCVFTKAGDHHDFPIVEKTIKGVWFETSLVGLKREGHLWDHTHKKIGEEN